MQGLPHLSTGSHWGWQSLFSCCSWPSGQAGWELVSGLFSPLHHHCLAKLTISSTHELLFQATLTPLCPVLPNLQHLVSPNHPLASSSPLLHIKGGGPGRIRDQTMHGRSQPASESLRARRLGLEMVPLEANSSCYFLFYFFFLGATPWHGSF